MYPCSSSCKWREGWKQIDRTCRTSTSQLFGALANGQNRSVHRPAACTGLVGPNLEVPLQKDGHDQGATAVRSMSCRLEYVSARASKSSQLRRHAWRAATGSTTCRKVPVVSLQADRSRATDSFVDSVTSCGILPLGAPAAQGRAACISEVKAFWMRRLLQRSTEVFAH